MKKEQISDALNMLNDDIIEETNKVRANAKPNRKWVKWGAVAACLCLAVIIAIPVLHCMKPLVNLLKQTGLAPSEVYAKLCERFAVSKKIACSSRVRK